MSRQWIQHRPLIAKPLTIVKAVMIGHPLETEPCLRYSSSGKTFFVSPKLSKCIRQALRGVHENQRQSKQPSRKTKSPKNEVPWPSYASFFGVQTPGKLRSSGHGSSQVGNLSSNLRQLDHLQSEDGKSRSIRTHYLNLKKMSGFILSLAVHRKCILGPESK